MPEYRRAFEPGGTFFFTVVTMDRHPILAADDAVSILRRAFAVVCARRPFTTDAVVVLPDHLYCLWTLPDRDADFSTRWRLIKALFSHEYAARSAAEGPLNPRRARKGQRGFWQHRFWEHTVRSDAEFEALCDYIHYNPVKHDHAACPHAWPFSSFRKFVESGRYPRDWCCTCSNVSRTVSAPVVSADITGE